MAAASVSVTTPLHVPGNRRELIANFTPSTSYPALGEPMTASLFGMQGIDSIIPLPPADGSALVTYDTTNKTLRIYTAINTEAGTSTDQSAKVIPLIVRGL